MKELEDIVAKERKATASEIATCTDTPPYSRSGMYQLTLEICFAHTHTHHYVYDNIYMHMYKHAVSDGVYLPPKQTMYLHRSKEELERMVRLSRENIQRERAAERVVKGPYFNKH